MGKLSGSYASVPCLPSSTSAASGCANMRMPMAAPGLSFPTRPAQTLSTVPNQGCHSQVSGQNADNVAVGRQLRSSELQSLFSELAAGRLHVPRPGQFNPGRLGESPPAPNVPAFVRPQGDMQLPKGLSELLAHIDDGSANVALWCTAPVLTLSVFWCRPSNCAKAGRICVNNRSYAC